MRNAIIAVAAGASVIGLAALVLSSGDDADPPPPAAFVTGCTAEKTEQECNSLWSAYVEERRNPPETPYTPAAVPATQAPAQAQAAPAPSQGLSTLEAVAIGVVSAAVVGYMTRGGGSVESLPPVQPRRSMVQTERPGRVPDVRPQPTVRQPQPYIPPSPSPQVVRQPTANPPIIRPAPVEPARQVTPTPTPAVRQPTQSPPVIRQTAPSPPRVSAPSAARPSTPSTRTR